MRKTLYLAESHDSMTSSALINSCAYSVRPKLLKKNVIKLKKGIGRDNSLGQLQQARFFNFQYYANNDYFDRTLFVGRALF